MARRSAGAQCLGTAEAAVAAQERALVSIKPGRLRARRMEADVGPIAVPVRAAPARNVPEDLAHEDRPGLLAVFGLDKQPVELAVPVGRRSAEPFEEREELQPPGSRRRVAQGDKPQFA